MNIKTGYTFDDVLLVPKYSKISSRKNVDLTVNLGKGIQLDIPLVSANMKTITETQMAKAMIASKGLAVLHRFCTPEQQIDFFKNSVSNYVGETNVFNHVACSVGVQEEDKILVDKIAEVGCKIICIDIAHGDHAACNTMTSWIAKKYPEMLIIAGNVATKSGALRLYDSGANLIKVGIGGGSLCTTRIETGNGVPQLTALENVYEASKENHWTVTGQRKFKIISDGGIRRSGDITKALCFSDAVMLGNLLAGTDEAPGKIIKDYGVSNSPVFKEYAGSSTHKANHIEGVVAKIPCKGPVKPIIQKLLEGLKSGCSYQGAANLDELKENPEFILITNSGLKESHPHALNNTQK